MDMDDIKFDSIVNSKFDDLNLLAKGRQKSMTVTDRK